MNNAMTTSQIVNSIARTFNLSEQVVGSNLKADLIGRGWDGSAWIGVSPEDGKKKEKTALFYRKPHGQFVFAL